MDMYLKHIVDDIRQSTNERRVEDLSRGKMPLILQQNIPTGGAVLLVHTKTGEERVLIHQWAERNGLVSMVCCVRHFSDVSGWKCKECNVVYYDNEVSSNADWGMISGTCFGTIVRCYQCDAVYNTGDDPDSDDEIKPISKLPNGVAIGATKDLLKRVLKKNRRKRKKKFSNVHTIGVEEDLLKMPLREIKLI